MFARQTQASGADASFMPLLSPHEIHASIDIAGRPIRPGARVRSFSYPRLNADGTVDGLQLDGERASYVEGVIERVTDTLDGCLRYEIRAERVIDGGEAVQRLDLPPRYFPPVNGTPQAFRAYPTFGVVVIEA